VAAERQPVAQLMNRERRNGHQRQRRYASNQNAALGPDWHLS
jgi:hypothetical protein